MINWKTCIGSSLLMIAGIELLKIKDYYHPEKITPLLIGLIVAFALSLITAVFLILSGLGIRRPRHVERKKVISRSKEIRARAANVEEVTVATVSPQRI